MLLFAGGAFAKRPPVVVEQTPAPQPQLAVQVVDTLSEYVGDELISLYYAEGVKYSFLLKGGTRDVANRYFERVLELDSLHAPALYQLASGYALFDTKKSLNYILRACEIEPDNTLYKTLLGRAYIYNEEFDKALEVYKELVKVDSQEPDHYRLLAMLYNENEQPYMAILVLDSAEMRFGLNEGYTPLKRQLMVATRQYDKAIEQSIGFIYMLPYHPKHTVAVP